MLSGREEAIFDTIEMVIFHARCKIIAEEPRYLRKQPFRYASEKYKNIKFEGLYYLNLWIANLGFFPQLFFNFLLTVDLLTNWDVGVCNFMIFKTWKINYLQPWHSNTTKTFSQALLYPNLIFYLQRFENLWKLFTVPKSLLCVLFPFHNKSRILCIHFRSQLNFT